MSLLETLEKRRQAAKMTRADFAKWLRVNQTQYAHLLAKRRPVRDSFLLRVLVAYPDLREEVEVLRASGKRNGNKG